MIDKVPVIIIGSDGPQCLAISRSLGPRGISIVTVDWGKRGCGSYSKYVTKSILAPDPEKSPDEFINCLMKDSDILKGSLIIPLGDIGVTITSKYKEMLSKYYIVSVPEWQIVDKCINKRLTAEVAINAGVPIPRTFTPDSINFIKEHKGEFEYPCILKPQVSSADFRLKFGVKKLFKINSFEELVAKFGLTYEQNCDMVIQEIIPGADDQLYTYYGYVNSENEVIAEFTGRKLRQTPPSAGVITAGESTYTSEAIELGRKFLRQLSYTGIGGIEFKRDSRDGILKLIEINPRFGLFTNLPVKCGVDFPWVMYKDLVSHEEIKLTNYEVGKKWFCLASDVRNLIFYHHQLNWRLIDFVRSYTGRKVYAYFDSDDLKPFLKHWLDFALDVLSFALDKFKLKRKKTPKTIEITRIFLIVF